MIEQRLFRLFSEGRIPHALLFVGSPSIVSQLVIQFVKKVTGSEKKEHPDIHHIFPEGKTGMHSLAAVKAFLQETTLAPYSAEKKCFLIYDAERMLPVAANAMLKTIEEPPPDTLFFLMTRHEEKILPTLLSRLHIFYASFETTFEKTPLQEVFLSVLFRKGDLDNVVKLLETAKKGREKELWSRIPVDLTLAQKEMHEKEIEGSIALAYQSEMESLFDMVLIWYRDIWVLDCDLPFSYLTFSQSEKRKKFPSWSLVSTSLSQAKLALERHVSSKVILESLLFRLGF